MGSPAVVWVVVEVVVGPTGTRLCGHVVIGTRRHLVRALDWGLVMVTTGMLR